MNGFPRFPHFPQRFPQRFPRFPWYVTTCNIDAASCAKPCLAKRHCPQRCKRSTEKDWCTDYVYLSSNHPPIKKLEIRTMHIWIVIPNQRCWRYIAPAPQSKVAPSSPIWKHWTTNNIAKGRGGEPWRQILWQKAGVQAWKRDQQAKSFSTSMLTFLGHYSQHCIGEGGKAMVFISNCNVPFRSQGAKHHQPCMVGVRVADAFRFWLQHAA